MGNGRETNVWFSRPITLSLAIVNRFTGDGLYDRRRVRCLTVLDEGNREGLEIAVGPSLPSRRVVRALSDLVAGHGRPSAVRIDNGPEFTAQPFVDWCTEHGIVCHYVQLGKPDQHAYIERFNCTYRTEVLNAHLFESIADLQALTRQWLRIYNHERAPRQPRPGAASHVSAEAHNRRSVSVGTVRLTGKLTKAQAHLCAAGRRTHRFCVSQGQRCRSRGLCGLSCLLEMVVRTTFTRSVASTGVQ